MVIHDTGCDMAPEHLPHIFDLFYITRKLDGGTVDIASQVGHRITVTWRLPPEEWPCTP
jgi:signal transduction histidine kinase